MKKFIYLKKALAAILALACLLSFYSCAAGNEPNEESTGTQNDEEVSTPETDPVEEDSTPVLVGDQSENENYKQLTVRNITKYKFVSFLAEKTDEIFCLRVPFEWSVEKANDACYTISREGTEIGKLILGEASDFREWQTVAKEETKTNGFSMTEHVEKYGSGDTLKFRYRYLAKQGSISITLTVDYTELNSKASYNLLNQSTLEKRSDVLNLGIVPEAKNGSILIIGNSFIGFSDVGKILTEMIRKNSKSTEVKAVSVGMATVKTYVSDRSLMRRIENGNYDAVFVCGLYSSGEISNLEILKNHCDLSDTRLIIFPAHNESRGTIRRADSRFPTLKVLDWKGAIEDLIYSGCDEWDFCFDDTYRHSTPIAGYVGAHMIYRAIYGEFPTAHLSKSIRQEEVNSVLGDFAETGYSKGPLYTLK